MDKDIYKDTDTIALMIEDYTNAPDNDEARAAVVAELAEQLDKTVASIRGVLVKQGVYKAKVRTTKNGATIVKKFELVTDISALMLVELTESEAESLEKSTKTTLKKILATLACVEDAINDHKDIISAE